MPIEREQLRAWIYDGLQQPVEKLGGSGGGRQLLDIERWVKTQAQQKGIVPPDHMGQDLGLDKDDADAVRECIWSLIIQGIVVPGAASSLNSANLPFFQVTEWGHECLRTGEYLPHDTGLFLNRLRAQIPAIDHIAELYLQEGLDCFRAGNHLAAAVMTGVASERILIVLRDAILVAIDRPAGKEKFLKATNKQTIKRIYEEIRKKIDPVREQMPPEMQETIQLQLEGIFNEIRMTRNDAGHPTGRIMEREEIHAILLLFPAYAKSAYGLIDWLSSNKL